MAASLPLEHKSSLRRLPFPACAEEALKRLYEQCLTFAHKQPSPKEIENVLDVIQEFVFTSSAASPGSASKKQRSAGAGSNLSSLSAATASLQELQMLNVILNFFATADSNPTVLSAAFMFLFMEPHSGPAKATADTSMSTKRTRVLSKLVSLAMGTNNANLLHCTANWIHQQGLTSPRSLALARTIIDEHLMMMIPRSVDALSSLSESSPLFVAHLLVAATEIYEHSFPSPLFLEFVVAWISRAPLVPLATCLTDTMAGLSSKAGPAGSSGTPLLGIAQWAVIGHLQRDTKEIYPPNIFSRLLLAVLESLVEAQQQREKLAKDVVNVKNVSLLIQKVEKAITKSRAEHVTEEDVQCCLDRLGQVLQAITSARCLSGKTSEIISSLKRLPANRMIEMYVINVAKL